MLEKFVEKIASIKSYTRQESRLIDHSDSLRRFLLGISGYFVLLILIVGCGQVFILKARLQQRKKE